MVRIVTEYPDDVAADLVAAVAWDAGVPEGALSAEQAAEFARQWFRQLLEDKLRRWRLATAELEARLQVGTEPVGVVIRAESDA